MAIIKKFRITTFKKEYPKISLKKNFIVLQQKTNTGRCFFNNKQIEI